jgi:hypothetical protein
VFVPPRLETVVEPWKDGLYALLAKFRKGEPIRSIRAGKAVPPPNGAPSDAKENVLPANPLHGMPAPYWLLAH